MKVDDGARAGDGRDADRHTLADMTGIARGLAGPIGQHGQALACQAAAEELAPRWAVGARNPAFKLDAIADELVNELRIG